MDKLARLQAQSGGLPFTPETYLSENHLYALTLGGHLTFAEANRRLPSAKAIAADAYLKIFGSLGRQSALGWVEMWQIASPALARTYRKPISNEESTTLVTLLHQPC
jgi:hypothetical protein